MKLMRVLLIFVGLFTLCTKIALAESNTWSNFWPSAGDSKCFGSTVRGGNGNRCAPSSWRPDLLIKADESTPGQYLGEGGVGPYTWNISCGSIDSTGKVTSLEGCCNSVTVTVTDACGTTTSKDIAVPTSALTLAGPEAVGNGSQYAVSGGTQPFSWSISCGTIDATGRVISVAGCCGSGSVTVTDDCGQSASKAVRFPSGQWVQTAYDEGECYRIEPDGSTSSFCQNHWAYDTAQYVAYCSNGDYARGESISGTAKVETIWGIVPPDGKYRIGTSSLFTDHWFVDSTGSHASAYCPTGPNLNWRPFPWKNTTYEWVCQ